MKASLFVVPSEHQAKAHLYETGFFEGRTSTSPLTREWFLSDEAFAAYKAGWAQGDETIRSQATIRQP